MLLHGLVMPAEINLCLSYLEGSHLYVAYSSLAWIM